MKAGPVEVGRLLQNRWRFCVPIYQRHYVWTRDKQWEPFWTEIRSKAIERLAGRERRFPHFMGAVVVEARGGFTATRVPSFQVVDGQQRLTTFQLLLAAARYYAIQRGLPTTAENISAYIFNDKTHLMEEPDLERYKVWPTQYDRPLFIDILTMDRKEFAKKYSAHFYAKSDRIYPYASVPRLLGAYGYFFERIRHSVETDDLDDEFTEAAELVVDGSNALGSASAMQEMKLDAIWQSLVEEFKVVEIVLEEGDDAQVIFETLNERGEPLLAADLVRNNIFQRADAVDGKAEKLVATYWEKFEDPFWSAPEKQGRYKKARIEFFLSNFIAGQIAGEVNLSKLFSEYKAFIKRRKYGSVSDEIRALSQYGEIYRELVDRKLGTPLGDFSRRLLPWDVTTVFPFVLRLWAESNVSEAEKIACLRMLMTFIVRRAICKLTTKNYNKLFLSLVAHLDSNEWSESAIASFILGQTSESGRLPRDDEFERRWLSEPVYATLQPARTRAVLEEIEVAKRTRFHETKALSDHLTVEHVMPSQWVKAWPLGDGQTVTIDQWNEASILQKEDDSAIGQIVRRNRLKDTFGNLTILTQPLNSVISNGAYAGKRVALESHSLLVLNREICEFTTWNEDAIVARGRALFEVAKELWKIPASARSDNAV